MVGHPATRWETEIKSSPETEMVSTQIAPPTLPVPAGGSVRPSAVMGEIKVISGYPLPPRQEAVSAALLDFRATLSNKVQPNLHT